MLKLHYVNMMLLQMQLQQYPASHLPMLYAHLSVTAELHTQYEQSACSCCMEGSYVAASAAVAFELTVSFAQCPYKGIVTCSYRSIDRSSAGSS